MPKGILKKQGANDGGAPKLRWDEDNLMITEAQKNSTMKITEPKTPFIHYDHENDQILASTAAVPPIELTAALEAAAANQFHSSSSLGSFDASESNGNHSDEWDDDDEDGEDLTEEERAKKAKFAKIRSQHYNMKAALQAARRKELEEDDDDEEENEEDERRKTLGAEEDEEDDEDEDEDEEEPTTGKKDVIYRLNEEDRNREPFDSRERNSRSPSSRGSVGGMMDTS
ncbi:hypothetical protein HDV05_000634 [Chytridiales sp. JEL 0842]|nr:hypothetical protein HDV05_000634 [Chytridiales sp. JEL 0842]